MLSRIVSQPGEAGYARVAWAAPVTFPENATSDAENDGADVTWRARMAEFERQAALRAAEAHDAGYLEGRESAREEAAAAVREALERLAAGLSELAQARADAIQQAESDMVTLALEVSRRVLHRELTLDPTAIQALVNAAVNKLKSQEVARVRVHPEHAEAIREFLDRLGKGTQIEVTADPVQELGGVVFELTAGALDASVATQLREIERGLADHFQK